jgi:hypothetical protein
MLKGSNIVMTLSGETLWRSSARGHVHLCCKAWLQMNFSVTVIIIQNKIKKKLQGLSPRVNYNNRATAACRRS